jgi:hypothetical protein
MSSYTDAWSWNEACVSKTCSSASHAPSDRTAWHELLKHVESDATFLPNIITEEKHGFMATTLRQNNITMEDAVVTSAKESKASPVKNQDNADCFL